MFYAIIRINMVFDINKFEDLVTAKSINYCTSITIVDSLQKLKKAVLKLIPVASCMFIACVTETTKSPLLITQYTDPNNLIGDINFKWADCIEKLTLPLKSKSIKDEVYTKTHQVLNKTTSIFYGNSSKDHSSKSLDTLVLKECLETGKLFCSGDIIYQDFKYYHQPRIFDCADTSMKMLIDYHILKCDELKYEIFLKLREELKSNFDNRPIKLFSGKNSAELSSYSDYLKDINLKKFIKEDILPGHLAYYLYYYGPIIVRTNTLNGHMVVVKGIVDNQVLIDDPWAGSNILTKFNEFNKKWDGTVIYLPVGYSKNLEKINEQRINLPP